jgi:hypothetical protein
MWKWQTPAREFLREKGHVSFHSNLTCCFSLILRRQPDRQAFIGDSKGERHSFHLHYTERPAYYRACLCGAEGRRGYWRWVQINQAFKQIEFSSAQKNTRNTYFAQSSHSLYLSGRLRRRQTVFMYQIEVRSQQKLDMDPPSLQSFHWDWYSIVYILCVHIDVFYARSLMVGLCLLCVRRLWCGDRDRPPCHRRWTGVPDRREFPDQTGTTYIIIYTYIWYIYTIDI